MLVKISIIIAACSGLHYADVQKKLTEVQSANPGAIVSFRLDKKAQCSNGQVMTGKDAKLLEALGK